MLFQGDFAPIRCLQIFAPASLGLGCFQETGPRLTRWPQPPRPIARAWGTGVFATFLKTCGILHVIILCLNPEHFVSVFPWNMLSSFQLSVQIFLQVMESFLCLENRFQLCLLRCLPIAVRLGVQCPGVCSPLLMTHLCLFTCLVNLSRVFFSGAAVQFLTISGFSTLFSFMFSV